MDSSDQNVRLLHLRCVGSSPVVSGIEFNYEFAIKQLFEGKNMGKDLLKKLEEKINEAIETIELSRMEVSDLKEQNEELENRYSDWEARLSSLIEKFEQLEASDETEDEVTNAAFQGNEEESGEYDETVDALDSEDAEDEDSDDEEELGSTFGTSADSLNESTESSQQYA